MPMELQKQASEMEPMAHLLPELPCSEGINQSCFDEAENMMKRENTMKR
jgi:hypothetical protein